MQEAITVIKIDAILNGPYLLAPTVSGMTVSWETNLPLGATVWYGCNDQLDNQLDVECERGTPWKDNSEGICMYRAVLTNLKSNTVYVYKVVLDSGEVREGSFQTLSANPEKIRIITLSDSHLFKISREFTNAVLTERPDVMIHSGDISLATGYQKDEYTTNWFKPGAEFLKEIPVLYAYGNHDISPYYEDFFMNVQKKIYHSDQTGHNFSFNYGNTHIIFLDSNPWGLFEMNAVNSGLPIDEVTRNNIEITLHWLTEDLKSAATQQATWRILVLHHPYTDDFTNKHIVPIGEKYHVNLVIAGHSHYYIKNVSVNDEIGAKTVYICQGSAESCGASIDDGKANERVLPDFPEVVAVGKDNYGCIVVDGDKLVYTAYGFKQGENGSSVVDEVVLVKEEPQITIDDISIKVEGENGNVVIEGTAGNEGHGLATVVLRIMDNDKEIRQNLFGMKGKERVVALNPGERKKIRKEYTMLEPGRHSIKVGNVRTVIDVLPPDPIRFESMMVKVGQGEFSNIIFVSAEVTNNQQREICTTVDLYIDDRNVCVQTMGLKAYEKRAIEFSYRFSKGGIYKVRIGQLQSKEITIEGSLRGTPMIKDLSGHGNNGFLRGMPKVGATGDGVTVSLDHDGDYIEIPDSESLHVEDGFTGIVWANLNRLATTEEMGHNPLMVKGISTGWGVTYLLRMAVERNGKLKWGTCHGTTEYSWQGGSATVGEWVQYTSTFDKQTGGASYCNDQKVAETIGIKSDENLCNWDGLPLFVGYSYIGHIIKEIGRPKYFTHLAAKISQVRFYRRKISQGENQYIFEHPHEIGLSGNELVAWLDFRDIETKGVHKTEWRKPAIFQPSYKTEKKYWDFRNLTTDTVILGSASLKAVVQVSDDGETIKKSKEMVLLNGIQTIDISDLPKAQYVRVITEFNSSIVEEGTYIPELNEYKILASSNQIVTEITWGTRADWERGNSEGAIGFEPSDRLKDFDEYTDVIHG